MVCLDATLEDVPLSTCLVGRYGRCAVDRAPVDDLALIPGTGGTTGKPKGVMLTGHNVEAMTAITLMSYPFSGRPIYLALAPLTHAAGVLCFPIMVHGGRIVIMHHPDIGEFLRLIGPHRVPHVFLRRPLSPWCSIARSWTGPYLLTAMLLVWRSTYLAGRADYKGVAAPRSDGAVRPDRGADDDFDHGARRAL